MGFLDSTSTILESQHSSVSIPSHRFRARARWEAGQQLVATCEVRDNLSNHSP